MRVNEQLISLAGVSLRLPNGRLLLEEVNVDIDRGHSIAVMGPSGSGKSTLLALLTRMLAPTSGVVRHHPSVDRDGIAWVFQETFVLGFRSVLDNAAMASFARGRRWIDAVDVARNAIDTAGLRQIAATRAGAISGGERQRLGVARALASGCSVIVADEPTANLDSELVASISAALVTGTPREGAIVIATHDRRVAERCDRMFMLVDGHLRAG